MKTEKGQHKRDDINGPRNGQQTNYSCNGANYNEGFAAAQRVLATVTKDADTGLNERPR